MFSLSITTCDCLDIQQGQNNNEIKLIQKYNDWQEIVMNPKNTEKTLSFFYNNPGWPMFEKLTKIAEKNIKEKIKNDIVVKWFKRYTPVTPEGIFAYIDILLNSDLNHAIKYINQTWMYQNLSKSFSIKFRIKFDKYISPASDAKRIKKLIYKKDYETLKAMKDIVSDKDITNYIKKYERHIRKQKFSDNDLDDPDTRYNLAKSYVTNKRYKKAAEVLIVSNKDEETSATEFFNLRREVACNIVHTGHPHLAYKVISMHKLNMFHPKQKKNYVKAEWLAGFYSFRFLNEKKIGAKHFKNAYQASDDAMHWSKNAFWIGEIYKNVNDFISAFDWYQKAYEHYNTFYGQLAYERLINISTNRFVNKNNISNTTPSIKAESNFNNRELVKVLKILHKQNIAKNIKFLLPFYKTLIDDIEDPNEEKLLINLSSTDAETDFILKTEAKKQKYIQDKRTFKKLSNNEMEYINKINSDPCFASLVHSVIRRESFFNPKAISHVGATGLMQIMPKTADFEMKRLKFYTGKNTSLFDVEKNLTIGSFILDRLLSKYDYNLVYVIAAYNAGEGNVNKFKKITRHLKNLNFTDTIELIPFKETRVYVKNVLHSMFVYQQMFETKNCYNCGSIKALLL